MWHGEHVSGCDGGVDVRDRIRHDKGLRYSPRPARAAPDARNAPTRRAGSTHPKRLKPSWARVKAASRSEPPPSSHPHSASS
ncbi:hypothetical protein D187_003725 [Cystobacter fuscus DSM 2262]|uniref:Uncharacterized protein n=1 Tax=Cystobacter fuscus (strain ATCC 25194 / DSM 2262 / NBRC 100088 / M29) TaxID=1242864 RepID=S9QBS2_CYSF2|nr:hypothetical protein D187_003725 [Cystobacter fuscus DSM 2262]